MNATMTPEKFKNSFKTVSENIDRCFLEINTLKELAEQYKSNRDSLLRRYGKHCDE